MGTLRTDPDIDPALKRAAAVAGTSVTRWANDVLRSAAIAALEAPSPAPPAPTAPRPTGRRRRRPDEQPATPPAGAATSCPHTDVVQHPWGTLCTACGTRVR